MAMFNNLCGAAQSIAPLVRALGGDAACDTVIAFATTLGKLGRSDPVPESVAVLRASLPTPTGFELPQRASAPPVTTSTAPRTLRPCPTCCGPVRPLSGFELQALDPSSPKYIPSFQERVKCDACREAVKAARAASGWVQPPRLQSVQSSVQPEVQSSVQSLVRPSAQPSVPPSGKPSGAPSRKPSGK